MGALPFSGRLDVEAIGVGCTQTAQKLVCFICNKLMMTVCVRLQLNMDYLVVYRPPGVDVFPSSMHELFFPGFVSALIPHRTWWIMETPKVLRLGRTMYFPLRYSPADTGSFLCQLRLLPKRLESMSGLLSRGLILRQPL